MGIGSSVVSVSLQLNTLTDLREFCKVLAGTDMVPKAYKGKPDDILVATLHGQEVGLPHLQALQSIAVVNGIPSIYGDAALALVRASGKLEDFDEWIEVDGVRQDGPFPIQRYADEGKSIVAYCRSKRVGMNRERVTPYSVDDAKRAKLWEKKGQNGFETPWCTVPQRMLMWRARGWNLRDQFGDVLKGLAIYEEAMDIETLRGRDGVYRALPEPEDPQMESIKEAVRAGNGTPPQQPDEKKAELPKQEKKLTQPPQEEASQMQEATVGGQGQKLPSDEEIVYQDYVNRIWKEAKSKGEVGQIYNEAADAEKLSLDRMVDLQGVVKERLKSFGK